MLRWEKYAFPDLIAFIFPYSCTKTCTFISEGSFRAYCVPAGVLRAPQYNLTEHRLWVRQAGRLGSNNTWEWKVQLHSELCVCESHNTLVAWICPFIWQMVKSHIQALCTVLGTQRRPNLEGLYPCVPWSRGRERHKSVCNGEKQSRVVGSNNVGGEGHCFFKYRNNWLLNSNEWIWMNFQAHWIQVKNIKILYVNKKIYFNASNYFHSGVLSVNRTVRGKCWFAYNAKYYMKNTTSNVKIIKKK